MNQVVVRLERVRDDVENYEVMLRKRSTHVDETRKMERMCLRIDFWLSRYKEREML